VTHPAEGDGGADGDTVAGHRSKRRGCRGRHRLSQRLRAATAAVCGSALLVIPLPSCRGSEPAESAVPAADLARIRTVMQRVEQDYLRPVPPGALTQDALKGMLSRLDPHSAYMNEREYRDMTADMRGHFGGIGIRMSMKGGVPIVISPIDDTPAARARLEPGDLITAIDGKPTDGMDTEEAVERIRGKPGSKVALTITRLGKAPFRVTLTRSVIRIATVTSKLEPHRIGYVRISEFAADTPGALTDAVAALKHAAGGRLNGFVLDLRDDPGGLLTAAVAVAGDFLDGGTVVSTRGRLQDDDKVYAAPADGDLIAGTKMAVLVNGGSASAAEIVAGALQDRHRATVMGTRSFGKGSVQTIVALDGEGALRLTTALYYTPSGRSIQGRGIVPDQVINVPKSEQVPNALVLHEADLYGALAPAPAGTGASPAAAYTRPIRPELIGSAHDDQLRAALADVAAMETPQARTR
jgi:carboxyl-terminal processing protease